MMNLQCFDPPCRQTSKDTARALVERITGGDPDFVFVALITTENTQNIFWKAQKALDIRHREHAPRIIRIYLYDRARLDLRPSP